MSNLSSIHGANISYFASLRNHLTYRRSDKVTQGTESLILYQGLGNQIQPFSDTELLDFTNRLKPQTSRQQESNSPGIKERRLVHTPAENFQIQTNDTSSILNGAMNDKTREDGHSQKKTLKAAKVGFNDNKPTSRVNRNSSASATSSSHGKGSTGIKGKSSYSKGVVKFPKDQNLKLLNPPTLNVLIKRGKFKGIYDDRESKCIYNHLSHPNHTLKISHNKCICKHAPIVQSPLKITYTVANSVRKDQINSISNIRETKLAEDVLRVKSRNGHIFTRVRQRLTESRVMGSDYEHFIFEKLPKNIKKTSSLNNIRCFYSNSTPVVGSIHEEEIDEDYENLSDGETDTILTELTDDFTFLETGSTNETCVSAGYLEGARQHDINSLKYSERFTKAPKPFGI